MKPDEARQGRAGKPILIVLIVGIVLVVLGYVIIGGIGVATEPDGSLEQTETLDAPDPATTAVEGNTVTPSEAEPQENEGVRVPQ
ncbi:hypothetical protein DYI37_08665 [Fulvimarina endophytica]|uniref:Uncharacterized protein n=1 Tax=Fulvimarina endophytica TaxID=2293836 RepID=A0A371X585_9HYPH|nr:hypothetical protein DYI37_08665 [Fulvimarina endophytica]